MIKFMEMLENLITGAQFPLFFRFFAIFPLGIVYLLRGIIIAIAEFVNDIVFVVKSIVLTITTIYEVIVEPVMGTLGSTIITAIGALTLSGIAYILAIISRSVISAALGNATNGDMVFFALRVLIALFYVVRAIVSIVKDHDLGDAISQILGGPVMLYILNDWMRDIPILSI